MYYLLYVPIYNIFDGRYMLFTCKVCDISADLIRRAIESLQLPEQYSKQAQSSSKQASSSEEQRVTQLAE